MTHSKFSPSSRHRWANCPASVKACEGLPSLDSQASIDGTRQHRLLSFCIVNRVDPNTLIGYSFKDDHGEYLVPDNWTNNIKVAYDWVMVKVSEGYHAQTEYRTDEHHGSWGTIDVLLKKKSHWIIVDYKSGFVPVTTERNYQMEHYTWLLENDDVNINSVIIQPNNTLSGHPVIKQYSGEVAGDIVLQIEACKSETAPFNPGPLQCHRCPYQLSCEALKNYVAINKDPQTFLNEKNLTDLELSSILENSPLIRDYLKACEEEAIFRVRNGRKIDGFKLVKGRGSRKWNLPDDQVQAKLIKMGVPKDATIETSVLSPAKVEKLKWTKKDGTQQSLSKQQLQMINSNYIERSVGAEQLVNEEDPREAVNYSVEGYFKPIMPKWLSKGK